ESRRSVRSAIVVRGVPPSYSVEQRSVRSAAVYAERHRSVRGAAVVFGGLSSYAERRRRVRRDSVVFGAAPSSSMECRRGTGSSLTIEVPPGARGDRPWWPTYVDCVCQTLLQFLFASID